MTTQTKRAFGRLDGRVALVTGGSRGIGQAICISLAAQGAAVIVHYRANAAAAASIVDQIEAAGGRAVALGADLADGAAVEALVAGAVARLGQIDILVNNAGEMTDGAVIELSDGDWERTLSVNLTAAFRLARACLPAMKAQSWGRIINMSSQAAYNGSANHAHYAASKSGLLGLTFSLAKEVGPFGVTVNLIAPGRVLTDMVVERMAGREEEWLRQTPMRRFGEADEVASAVVFLASDQASYITGANLNVNGGLLMG